MTNLEVHLFGHFLEDQISWQEFKECQKIWSSPTGFVIRVFVFMVLAFWPTSAFLKLKKEEPIYWLFIYILPWFSDDAPPGAGAL